MILLKWIIGSILAIRELWVMVKGVSINRLSVSFSATVLPNNLSQAAGNQRLRPLEQTF